MLMSLATMTAFRGRTATSACPHNSLKSRICSLMPLVSLKHNTGIWFIKPVVSHNFKIHPTDLPCFKSCIEIYVQFQKASLHIAGNWGQWSNSSPGAAAIGFGSWLTPNMTVWPQASYLTFLGLCTLNYIFQI